MDFSQIKDLLCEWLEQHWDHKMLIWDNDPWLVPLTAIDETVVAVPFNPTAENMAKHMIEVVGPSQLTGTGVTLVRCVVEETRKCRVSYE